MEKLRHVSLVVLICLVIGIQGIFTKDTCANSIPHLKILLFKFGGTKQALHLDGFDEFTYAIRMAIFQLNSKLAHKGSDFRYLSDLDYIKYKEFERKHTPNSDKGMKEFYKNERALEIHTGNVGSKIVGTEKIAYVRNHIFLINSETKTRNPIALVHNITAEEYDFLKNIQQAIMCYALAMDAKRMKKENAIVTALLSESRMMMSDIDSTKLSFVKSFKKVIENELKDLNPLSTLNGSN